MHTTSKIRDLLRQLDSLPADALEGEELEFKSWEHEPKALHRMLRETVVCLANAKGGTIVLGVRDGFRTRKEAIQGVEPYNPIALKRSIYDGTDPHILVEIEELVEPEGTLILIHVPRGIPPHTTTEGVARIRIGKECKPLTGRALARLLANGGQTDTTAELLPSVTIHDLDKEEITHLRRIIRSEAGNEELVRLEDHPLLKALGLISNGSITFACLLLLGKTEAIASNIPQHEIIFLRYRNTTAYEQRKDFRGPILADFRSIEGLMEANNRITSIQTDGFGQLEIPSLTWGVIREALLNAVTHRDYFQRQGIQIALHEERLEVISPGGFPGGITPENVLRHPPIHRNELLARVFQTIGLVNRVGLGVDRIYDGVLRQGKDIPEYSSDETYVRLSIPLRTHESFALLLAEEARRSHDLELDDLILLRKLIHTATLDRWSAASVLQAPEEEAAARLVHLRKAGYLVVRGRGRGASYDLSGDLSKRLRAGSLFEPGPAADNELIKSRILEALNERGRLTNSDIREFSGMSRIQVYQLVKELETKGKVRFAGKGRGAHILPA